MIWLKKLSNYFVGHWPRLARLLRLKLYMLPHMGNFTGEIRSYGFKKKDDE